MPTLRINLPAPGGEAVEFTAAACLGELQKTRAGARSWLGPKGDGEGVCRGGSPAVPLERQWLLGYDWFVFAEAGVEEDVLRIAGSPSSEDLVRVVVATV